LGYLPIYVSYIYGGLSTGVNATAFDDAYVLSLPSFTWTKWYRDDNASISDPDLRRHSSSCTVVKQLHMLIIGGTFPDSAQCDSAKLLGTHDFDLGQEKPVLADWTSDVKYNVSLQNSRHSWTL
jgi:hypothetical protein